MQYELHACPFGHAKSYPCQTHACKNVIQTYYDISNNTTLQSVFLVPIYLVSQYIISTQVRYAQLTTILILNKLSKIP